MYSSDGITKMSVKKTKIKKYVLVAPDGGWGYMICVGVIFNVISVTSFFNCFGVIYKELFIQLKMDSTSLTLFNGVACLGVAVSGLMTNVLLKYLSFRKLGLITALIYNIGMFGTAFTQSKLHFYIFQGVIQSIGQGIIINLTFTVLNNYFVIKRLFAVSLVQTVAASFGLLTPGLVKWAIEVYGFRGCILLITGVCMHTIFAMALMQPVEWHMKKVEILEYPEESQTFLVKDIKFPKIKEDVITSVNSTNKSERVEIKDGEKPVEQSKLKNFVHQIVDVSLFRTYFLSNSCIGVGLCLFSEMTFIIMVPQALYSMGWDENEVAWALSLNALGDLVTRTLLIFMSSLLVKLGSHQIYICGLVVALGARLGMLWSDNRIAITAFMTILGFSRCTIMVLMPVVVGDSVPLEKFSSAMGMLYMFLGIFNLIMGPVVGAVRDITDSYAIAFYILSSLIAIVIICWTIELFYKKTKHKRLPKKVKYPDSMQ